LIRTAIRIGVIRVFRGPLSVSPVVRGLERNPYLERSREPVRWIACGRDQLRRQAVGKDTIRCVRHGVRAARGV